MSFFTRTLGRLRREDHGFSLMETVVALGVLFISLLVLARTAAVGFSDIALSRQRTQANQIANKVLEQVRGLTYERVGEGLKTSDAAADTSMVLTCPDGAMYFRVCPESDPNAEKIKHTTGLPLTDPPLVPHTTTYGASEGYTSTFTASIYVTEAKSVPQTGAYRVTALVSWSPPARPGVSSQVTTQSLLYTPEGTTDAATGGGTAPFFYGTGSIGRAPVTITPNAGVTGGTGVTGLPVWESITEDLYGLDASVQQQQLTRTESKAVMTGAHKLVAGVETVEGGDTAEALADNDPGTPVGTDSSPASLMQSDVSANVSGGGNALEVQAASGNPAPSCAPPGLKWFTGFETGGLTGGGAGGAPWPGGMMSGFYDGGGASSIDLDNAVKRSGTYSMKVAPAGQWTGMYYRMPTSQTTAVYRFGIRFASLPTADVKQLVYMKTGTSETSTTRWAALRYNAAGQRLEFGFQWADLPPGGVVSGPVVQAGTWYMIDVKLNVGANPWTAEWMVDGVPQPSTTNPQAATTLWTLVFGGYDDVYTTHIDDVQVSTTLADYPLPDSSFKVLKPNGTPAWSFCNGCFQNNDNSAISSTTYTRLDEVPAFASNDYVKQLTNDATGYVELDFENPVETCIAGVMSTFTYAASGSQSAEIKGTILDGSTESCILGAISGGCIRTLVSGTGMRGKGGMVTPAASPWTNAAVSGIKSRIGYSNDANPDPYWHAVLLEIAAVPEAGGGSEGAAGTETGSTASTTAASVSTPCGNPTQLDGRACSYAREDYSTAGPPHLSARLDLTGSAAGKAKIYKYQPSTSAGSTSYVWGRRAAGGGGAGTVKETAVRYPGIHDFGALPTVMGAGPANWPGYWLRYDAGTSAATVSAEAGVGASAPSYTSVGSISYWNGSGITTISPPAAGGTIPICPLTHESGGFRIEIKPGIDTCAQPTDGTLSTSQSFTTQVPSGAVGTADRTEAKAQIGAPVVGTFTYKITQISTGNVIVDLTISVDLGTMSATARYAP